MIENTTLHTLRLSLRPLNLRYADDLHEVLSNHEVMRFWHTSLHKNLIDTSSTIMKMLEKKSACWWTICLKNENRALGFVGYISTTNIPGLGYILHSDYWRRGYATEAVRAALEYGFHTLKLDRVELWIHENNAASRGLAEKIGFIHRGRFRQKYPSENDLSETMVYGMLANEWGFSQPLPGGFGHVPFYTLQPVLPVCDVTAAVNYYQTKLGFFIDYIYGQPATHACVYRGEWSTQCARIQLTSSNNVEPTALKCSLYITVGPHIDKLYEEYCVLGVDIADEIKSQPWGMREFALRDPDGHILRFATAD